MLKKSKQNDIAQYLKRRYAVRLLECEEGGYFVEVPDLPGCMSQGETIEEALKNIQEAKELWLEGAAESGHDVPQPADEREYSGKFIVRLPVSLHERLALSAEREGVSLNQYVALLLAENNALRNVEKRISQLCASAGEQAPAPLLASGKPRRGKLTKTSGSPRTSTRARPRHA